VNLLFLLILIHSVSSYLDGPYQKWQYDSFSPNGSLVLAGCSTIKNGVLFINPLFYGGVGSAFKATPVSIIDHYGNGVSFKTSFTFQIKSPPYGIPGEGFTFVIASSPVTGSADGFLGYQGSNVLNSVAIEFDILLNPDTDNTKYNDPNSNHIGFDLKGLVASVVVAPFEYPMISGKEFRVDLHYADMISELKVHIFLIENPEYFLDLSLNVNLASFGHNVYLGFTSSTSQHNIASTQINQWEYESFTVPSSGSNLIFGWSLFALILLTL